MSLSSRAFFAKQFEALNSNRPASKRISAIGMMSFDLRGMAPELATKATANPHLNDVGKRAARQSALRELFVNNAQNRNELARIRKQVQADLDSLALPTLEKDDIVGEMREAEARAIVRTLPPDERNKLSRMSPTIAAAVVRAPPELSGVSPSVHAQLRSELIETVHPEKMAAIKAEMQALEFAELAVKDTGETLSKEAAFAPGEERAYVAQIEAQLDEPALEPPRNPNDLDEMIAEHRRNRSGKAS